MYIQLRLVRSTRIQKNNQNKTLSETPELSTGQIAKHINALAFSIPYFLHFLVGQRQFFTNLYNVTAPNVCSIFPIRVIVRDVGTFNDSSEVMEGTTTVIGRLGHPFTHGSAL